MKCVRKNKTDYVWTANEAEATEEVNKDGRGYNPEEEQAHMQNENEAKP